MSGDTTLTDWKEYDFSDRTDCSLVTDISRTFNNFYGEKRAMRRMQKLREELVREHIETHKKTPTAGWAVFRKLFKLL